MNKFSLVGTQSLRRIVNDETQAVSCILVPGGSINLRFGKLWPSAAGYGGWLFGGFHQRSDRDGYRRPDHWGGCLLRYQRLDRERKRRGRSNRSFSRRRDPCRRMG